MIIAWQVFWVALLTALAITCLDFAGGAMIFLVVAELLPSSLAMCTANEAAWGVPVGLVAMLGFIAAIGL